MNAQPRSFMLLPDWTYEPSNLKLGTLLYLSKETKLPDPDVPANKNGVLEPDDSNIKRQQETSFSFVYDKGHTSSLGFEAELPIFSPISGGLGYNRHKNDRFTITCDTLETERFAPSDPYLGQALQNDSVAEYCRQENRPSIYLVTGLKIASHATIHQDRGRGLGGKFNAQVDGTGAGVPLTVGPTIEGDVSQQRETSSTIQGPFVLAYQLKRLRMKKDGSVKKTEGYTKHALFSDVDVEGGTIDVAPPLEDAWEVEDVGEGNKWEGETK